VQKVGSTKQRSLDELPHSETIHLIVKISAQQAGLMVLILKDGSNGISVSNLWKLDR
jgi:hypothetical protein